MEHNISLGHFDLIDEVITLLNSCIPETVADHTHQIIGPDAYNLLLQCLSLSTVTYLTWAGRYNCYDVRYFFMID